MKMIFRICKHDIRCLFSNVVTAIIVLGLVLLPSLFSWYNVLACWDVFDNTDNLKVAVANTDTGYQSDLVPLTINLGDQVQNALLEDKEMEWVFKRMPLMVHARESITQRWLFPKVSVKI